MASPRSTENEKFEIDPSEPFKGVIVCCTSIPPDQRTLIAQKVAELGGVHKYDLTPDVTHLVVGDYDTPKYRHVARERPDVKAMDAGWIDAISELWKNDDEIDYLSLENNYQLRPFETCGAESPSQEEGSPAARGSLLICLTGFGDQRDDIADRIVRNGGRYTGDLTRRCSHLIVSKPEGKKFTAAKSWGVHTVTLDWLNQSVERGMILEETKFDPLLPPEEQGVGAWVKKDPNRVSLGKRSRSAALNGGGPEEGVRKLRKTASMKLSFQRNNLWGDILGTSGSREYSFAQENQPDVPSQGVPTQPGFPLVQDDQRVFSNCAFVVHGFTQQRTAILEQTIATLGGSIAPSLQDPTISSEPTDAQLYRFLIVPQASQPATHPQVPHDSIHVITEFYIENCLHNKRFFSPDEQVLGRPFTLFPIPGFSNLTVCSAAFTGIELNQVARSVTQLGAKFSEEFRRTTSVLVCKSLESIRKEKLKCAVAWGVPVVSGDWLWECISTGYLVPIEDFVYPQLKKRRPKRDPFVSADEEPPADKAPSRPSGSDTSRSDTSRPPVFRAGVDTTGFDPDTPENTNGKRAGGSLLRGESITSADFMTARTQPGGSSLLDRTAGAAGGATPLSEPSSAALNKSPQAPAKPPAAAGLARTISGPAKVSDADGRHLSVPGRAPSAPPPETKQPALRRQDRQGSESREEPLGEPLEEPLEEQQAAAADQGEGEEEERARQLANAAEMRQGLTSALSGLIRPTAGLEALEAEARPRRRRQKILGRAISNASNASSAASMDGGRPAPESLRADDEEEEPPPPPATQLEYRDPDAVESKAMLMSRMTGGSGTRAREASLSSSSGKGKRAVGAARSLRKR